MAYHRSLRSPHQQRGALIALIECRLHRIGKAAQLIAVVGHRKTVNQQIIFRGGAYSRLIGKQIRDIDKAAASGHQTGVAALKQDIKLCGQLASFRQRKRSHNRHPCSLGIAFGRCYHILNRMFFHHRTTHGRYRLANASE